MNALIQCFQIEQRFVGPRVRAAVTRENVHHLLTDLFWLIFVKAWQSDVQPHVLDGLRQKLKDSFMEVFIRTDPDRDEVFKTLPFLLSEAVILCFERSFVHSLDSFHDGFRTFCYRAVFEEILGYRVHPATIHHFRANCLDASR